jgi:lipopolysaccharide/colanic/teichoic acid biosynthesis glycosyltransferase
MTRKAGAGASPQLSSSSGVSWYMSELPAVILGTGGESKEAMKSMIARSAEAESSASEHMESPMDASTQAGAVVPMDPTRAASEVINPARAVAWAVAKRTFDAVLALVMLIAVAPLMAIIALLVKFDSPGPVLFRQQRCGRHRQLFVVLKFRTMTDGASPEAHRHYIAELARNGAKAEGLKKLTRDERVTRIGALLRKSSLDELPQLYNVLIGQMSLVGPRPAIDYELEHYEPEHYARFDVRPGLTGLWQVSGRSRLGFHEMLALDAAYARETGPLIDAQILVRTPLEIFRGCAA